MIKTCYYCGQPIRYVYVHGMNKINGKSITMIIGVEPSPSVDRGQISAKWEGDDLVGYRMTVEKPLGDDHQRWIDHGPLCKPIKTKPEPGGEKLW